MPATPFLAVCFPNMKHSYELVNSGAIKGIKIGTQIKVPKRSVVEFMGI